MSLCRRVQYLLFPSSKANGPICLCFKIALFQVGVGLFFVLVVPEGLSLARTVLRGEAGEPLVLRTNADFCFSVEML